MNRLVAAVLVSGVVLSGCGVADSTVRPGSAAVVGDTTISIDDVDSTAVAACDYIRENPPAQGQPSAPRPLAVLRQQITAQLVQRAAVEQILDETGVELGGDYTSGVAELEQNVADLPADQREAIINSDEAGLFTSNGLRAVAEQQLADESDTTPVPDAIDARAQELLSGWFQDNDVDINPVYRLGIDDDGLLTSEDGADSQLSVAVSGPSLAEVPPAEGDAAGQEKYSDYLASLPDDQVCG